MLYAVRLLPYLYPLMLMTVMMNVCVFAVSLTDSYSRLRRIVASHARTLTHADAQKLSFCGSSLTTVRRSSAVIAVISTGFVVSPLRTANAVRLVLYYVSRVKCIFV